MDAIACHDNAVLAVAHQFALGFGGVPESLLSLARALRNVGVRLDVLSGDGVVCDAGRLSALPGKGQHLSRQELAKTDVSTYRAVLVAGAWNPIACRIALKAKRHGVFIAYAPKGNLAYAEFKRPRDLKKYPYLATVELALLMLADRIIFSSELERNNSLLSKVFRGKSAVIPEPFAGPILTPRRQPSRKMVRFGFMAEIAPRKGLSDLVTAFVAWQLRDRPEAELHIAGEPRPASEQYCERIRAVGASAPQPDRIVWRGPLRGRAREEFYEDIDFFVCPTRFESFGLTPLEALWHGTPVLVTRNLGALEFVADEQCMIDLGAGSPDEILAALKTAMTGLDAYLESAGRWRSRLCPGLSGDRIASAFLHQFGLSSEAIGDLCA